MKSSAGFEGCIGWLLESCSLVLCGVSSFPVNLQASTSSRRFCCLVGFWSGELKKTVDGEVASCVPTSSCASIP